MHGFDLLDLGRVIGNEYLLMDSGTTIYHATVVYNCICLSLIKLCLSELSAAESKAWAQIAC